MAGPRVDKWRRWCEGAIRSEVLTMHLHRHAYRQVGNIVRANGSLPESYFWEYLRDTYAVTQSVAVRRQAEHHDRRVSTIARVLSELADSPETISSADYAAMWDLPEEGAVSFAQHFGGEVGHHVDPRIPTTDLELLLATAAGVKAFVDRHLAHSDARPRRAEITFDELNEAIDVIGRMFTKYTLLLTASSYIRLVPEIQHDWLAIFETPWIRQRDL